VFKKIFSRLNSYAKSRWGQILLAGVLLTIISLNLKPGFLILGNDNFSPELDPKLTLSRSLESPAWRSYRVLGIPSDSEQADFFRTAIFLILSKFLPIWVISQGYLFFTFFIASFSLGFLAKYFSQKAGQKNEQLFFLAGGLFYLTNLLTSWLYFYPLHLFIAAYAFLPLVCWRLAEYFQKNSFKNRFYLLVSSLLLSTSALTATMFLVCLGVIVVFNIIFFFQNQKKIASLFFAFLVTVVLQGFWLFPFLTYVKSNSRDLQISSINREITSTTIENEIKNNDWKNSLRYYSSWLETKENGKDYTFPYRDWYRNSKTANFLSFLPPVLAAAGLLFLLANKNFVGMLIGLMSLIGWFLIKGINPPLGIISDFLSKNIPLFAQVFRWQSSKFWPFLAMSLPILGCFGLIFFLKIIKNNLLKVLLVLFVFGGSLFFVFPYFKGQLIRSDVFVKVPSQYYGLARFLKKNDPLSRIYPAPETNSLYFRNYCWGFWGSTVLNYLLPNPIVEKALIIGSAENEQAFDLLHFGYYSENPLLFARILKMYNSSLILADENNCDGNVGYRYDWEINKKMVDENPYFEKIWQEDKLSLYKIKDDFLKAKDFDQVAANHNWLTLNALLVNSGENPNYFSGGKFLGKIYPFAFNFDRVKVENKNIFASFTYQNQSTTYKGSVSRNLIYNSPLRIEYLLPENSIVVSPALYHLVVNNEEKFSPNLPKLTAKLEKDQAFLTFEENVFNLKGNKQTVFDVPFKIASSSGSFFQWGPKSNPVFFPDESELLIENDSIIEVSLDFVSPDNLGGSLCIWSKNYQECLNKNINFKFPKDQIKTSFFLPRVVEKGDHLSVFIEEKSAGPKLSVKDLTFIIYQDKKPLKIEGSAVPETFQTFDLPLKKGDNFELIIPLAEGQNSYLFKPDKYFFPKTDTATFTENISRTEALVQKNRSLLLKVKEANASVYPRLERIDPADNFALIAFSGENLQAIPSTISLRNIKQDFPFYKKQLSAQKVNSFFDLVFLPAYVRSYFFEFLSTGIGPRETVNRIDNLVFQIIPKEWAQTVLVPENFEPETNNKDVFKINQAVSPNWQLLEAKGDPIRINGWEQGWLVTKNSGENLKVDFWPNKLAYLGYFLILIIAGATIIFPLLRLAAKFWRKRNSPPVS